MLSPIATAARAIRAVGIGARVVQVDVATWYTSVAPVRNCCPLDVSACPPIAYILLPMTAAATWLRAVDIGLSVPQVEVDGL